MVKLNLSRENISSHARLSLPCRKWCREVVQRCTLLWIRRCAYHVDYPSRDTRSRRFSKETSADCEFPLRYSAVRHGLHPRALRYG
uniref:Uncharacterized protein n=1 Tax=Physcomitrium patens TaxID=3218 RepID=A0A2K1JPI6_PHYPA|nr:hypothetical protein PHYPA_015812 [Physcomitrium patens]